MYYWKLFLWQNGGKSTEYTDYLIAPIFIEDKLDETLSTGEVILERMPIAEKQAFAPKTKFRLERYASSEFIDEPKTYDFVVEHDDVEEYMGCPTICCHRIHLIEASVIAQGMHVDNIALTYELQDVNLNYKTIRDDQTIIGNNFSVVPGGHSQPIRQTDRTIWAKQPGSFCYFRNSYRYVWDDNSLFTIRNLKTFISVAQENIISITVPKLICQGCYNPGVWTDLFEMNTITRIYEIKTLYGKPIGEKVVKAEKASGAIAIRENNDAVFYSNGSDVKLRSIQDWVDKKGLTFYEFDKHWSEQPIIARTSSSYSNKTLKFSTTQLSDDEILQGYSYSYVITTIANPINQNGMISNYEKLFNGISDGYMDYLFFNGKATTTHCDIVQASSVCVSASFSCVDLSVNAEGGAFLMKGVKYSCFQLLRKALLTIDTQILDNSQIGLDSVLDSNFNEIGIQYPIIISSEWIGRLKTMKVQETLFEGKNLWEILLQIGYYLHAIPKLKFSEDGTDRFLLEFKQLGNTNIKEEISDKITVFNSKNLSEYFTQYDSYVTNMFSPQNVVDEWLVAKTLDNTYLVSNNTAEIQTKFPILEIVEFDIEYDGSSGGIAGKKSALQYIFEESIYQILTSDNPIRISPAKGNSIFYTLGDNRIQGLNYIPPSANNNNQMALKEICRRLFGAGGNSFIHKNLRFNSLKFHVKYKTQDSMRISQVRPDLQNFMKNSSYEKYPHHEQFYGQQDKIIDSERFSANLFGKLIRVGNNIYQSQEYAKKGIEKTSGELYVINGNLYYVVETENEYYPDAIFQKITYSKDFNQLSNVVTIPSEPRFYEISERSKIRREIRLMDFFELSTTKNTIASAPRFLNDTKWKSFIKYLLFNINTVKIPNFAYSKFLADNKRLHNGSYGQIVAINETFPSSEIDRTDPNNITPKASNNYADCIVPLLHFPLHDGIAFEWDMEDNFKVGNYVDNTISGGSDIDDAYLTLQPLRYVDVMGRADLFTFKLFNKEDEWTFEQTQQIPKAVIIPNNKDCQALLPEPYLIGIDKDCREELSFNYQINLLHKANEGDDDFITFPNLFGKKSSTLKMCLLTEPQSMFNENIDLSQTKVLADNVKYELIDNEVLNSIELKITSPKINLAEVQSIVLYQENVDIEDSNYVGKYAYIVKNVGKLNDSEKLQSWWLYPVFNS